MKRKGRRAGAGSSEGAGGRRGGGGPKEVPAAGGRKGVPAGRSTPWLPRVEWGVAILLTLVALSVHIAFLTHAGPLWRDEVNTVEYATMSSLSEIYGSLQYDGFPLLYTLLLRGWIATGLGSGDFGLRIFGFLVGIAFLGSLWLACRILRSPTPIIALALFGLNSWSIRTVDSIRPYGLGMVLIVIALALLWRAIESPTPRRFVAAAISAVLAVHCMYQNAFLLFGVCLAGGVVSLREARIRTAGGIVLVGAAAAISLLVYSSSIILARSWNPLNQIPGNFQQIVSAFTRALGSGASAITWAWLALAALSLLVGIRALRSRAEPRASGTRPTLAVFCAAVLVATSAVYLIALKVTRLPTQPWYYVPLMAVIAPVIDASAWLAVTSEAKRIGRVALALAIAAMGTVAGWPEVTERRSNVDLVASYLGKEAVPGDLIVVSPMFYAVTFHRYYKGAAHWMVLPPIQDRRIHRYDLFKEAMASPDPIAPVREAMAGALQSGHRVWLVGEFPAPNLKEEPPMPPPAPHPVSGWHGGPYREAWPLQVTNFLATHALTGQRQPVPAGSRVSIYENVYLVVATGWH